MLGKQKWHIERYGATFFGMCVVVAAWQCMAMTADLRVMGRGPQEWLMAPLVAGNLTMLLTPLRDLFALTGEQWNGLVMYKSMFICLANALLLLSPYWLLPRRWRWLVWIPMTLLTLWVLMQLCYCRAYDDLMPWRSLAMTDNVNAKLMDSTLSLLRWHDLLIVVPFLLLVVADLLAVKTSDKGKSRFKPLMITLAACVATAVVGYGNVHEDYGKRYLHNFGNRGYFSQNGLIPYGIFTVYWTVFNSHTMTDEERTMVERFLTDECPNYNDNPYCSTQGRNLVLIIVESLHTWPIGMTVEGREVTPVLNRLVKSDSVIYAPHVLFQTSHGHSSDAHFIYNTGLAPLRDGVVAVEWGDGNYPSLAAALDGYDCREVICTPGMNWNQTMTARTYGFDSLYTRDDLNAANLLSLHQGIDDAALTDFAARLLPQMRQPFFLEMVTMTMHVPYNNGSARPSWITASDTLNAEARDYLNCVNITDSCIGAFIDEVRCRGLMDNTVVAIVSDHTQIYLNRVKGMTDYDWTPDDWGIPLIIVGCDTTMRYDDVIGQIDVFPTLLDVMGANAYPWKGFGHSILRYPVIGAVQPRNMSIIGDSLNALTPQQRQVWDISRLIIKDRGTSIFKWNNPD